MLKSALDKSVIEIQEKFDSENDLSNFISKIG